MKKVQAKHIPDAEIMRHIRPFAQGINGRLWAHNSDLYAVYPLIPYKVILAKMRALIKRKLCDGCACGCYGGYTITAAGKAFLDGRP